MLYPYLLLIVAACRGQVTPTVKCNGAVSLGMSANVAGSIESGGALNIGNLAVVESYICRSVGAMSVGDGTVITVDRMTIGDRNCVTVTNGLHAAAAVTLGTYNCDM